MTAMSILIKTDAFPYPSIEPPTLTPFLNLFSTSFYLAIIIFIPYFLSILVSSFLSLLPAPCESVCPVCRLWGK